MSEGCAYLCRTSRARTLSEFLHERMLAGGHVHGCVFHADVCVCRFETIYTGGGRVLYIYVDYICWAYMNVFCMRMIMSSYMYTPVPRL